MSGVEVLIAFGKALFVVFVFTMNVAAILTWADRRQGAMLQDRIGPERAVVWIPRWLAQGAVFVPALAVAVGALVFAYGNKGDENAQASNAMLFMQAAIFMTWATALVIGGVVRRRGVRNSFDNFLRSIGDPRRFFWAGIVAHVAVLLAFALTSPGTPDGELVRSTAFGVGAALFAAAVLGGALYATLQMKDDRVGLRLIGLLHPAADGVKFAFKEDFIPPNADRFLHGIAPIISTFPALVVLAVVPFGDTLCFGAARENVDLFGIRLIEAGRLDPTQLYPTVPRDGLCVDNAVALQAVDLNIGLLYFFALAGTGIVGAAIAGWASDNKFSLLGGLRAASQMVSYEVTLGLTLVGAIMVYGTLRVDEMVRWQAENTWGIFVQPLAFVLFFAAAVAEAKRIPFDLPEGESEIVAGYMTEYSSFKFAMFYFAEYAAVVTSSALMVAIFFGGWHLPFLDRDALRIAVGDNVFFEERMSHLAVVLIGFLAFILKTLTLCFVQLTIRWTLPRFRYDQLMRLGWRKLLPLSLANIVVTAAVILAIQGASATVIQNLDFFGDLTEAVVAVGGLATLAYFVGFLLEPASHRRVLSSTAAKFAAMAGGTRSAKMGA